MVPCHSPSPSEGEDRLCIRIGAEHSHLINCELIDCVFFPVHTHSLYLKSQISVTVSRTLHNLAIPVPRVPGAKPNSTYMYL